MTENQKNQIISMRESGESYGNIAVLTGISESTIKTTCLRNKKKNDQLSYCKNCNKKLKLVEGKKKKVFCSDKCRMEYWKNHKELITKKPSLEKICPICNKPFNFYSSKNAKYCSWVCYLKSKEKKVTSDDR